MTTNSAPSSHIAVGLNFLFPDFERKRVSSDKTDNFTILRRMFYFVEIIPLDTYGRGYDKRYLMVVF